MADTLERFFNWQSDMDWTWGPFLPLRPPRDRQMRPWVWVRLFSVLSLAGGLMIVLIGMACMLGPRFAAVHHWSVPPSVMETLATVTAMASDPTSQVMAIGVILSLPLLFFSACLPFHVAWNRRAARLSQRPEVTEVLREQADVWPPAPSTGQKR